MKDKPTYLGHRKRLKEKYKTAGIDGWLDYEILELLLGFTIARKDTKPMAKDLLAKYKTLSGVLDADISGLVKVKGISEHSALLLKLIKDTARLYHKQPLKELDIVANPEGAVSYLLSALRGCREEQFHVLFLNKKNSLVAAETLQKGTIDSSVVYPRNIVERALHNGATGVIISHNHPSGSVKPSRQDLEVTESVKKALATVDVELIDHIVIAGSEYCSLKREGLF
jgi:DNA repair protein RadC